MNPVAGMGGPVGLKGTDGRERQARAIELGARPGAARRAGEALESLARRLPSAALLAPPGLMGAELGRAHGFDVEVLSASKWGPTSASDTRLAAEALLQRDIDLLLFAGGDGTARDILAVVGTTLPVLGIPSGVKMHSGVFASSPRAAGWVAADFVHRQQLARQAGSRSVFERTTRAEVVDRELDASTGAGPVRLFGEMLIPLEPERILAAKASGPTADGSMEALQEAIARDMEPGRLYILGPGQTVGGIRRHLGLADKPLAITAVCDRVLLADDVNEERLLELIARAMGVTLIVGVIGGQGSLLGRGNQQLSARVIREIGMQNIRVIASMDKLARLSPPCLYVDTGDPELDEALAGYRTVQVGPGRSAMLEIRS